MELYVMAKTVLLHGTKDFETYRLCVFPKHGHQAFRSIYGAIYLTLKLLLTCTPLLKNGIQTSKPHQECIRRTSQSI